MLVARHYVIGGRVQGVGFRFFSQAAASREGIGGWVRNRADGCVEVLAEGDVIIT
jgi:acylphosphatase